MAGVSLCAAVHTAHNSSGSIRDKDELFVFNRRHWPYFAASDLLYSVIYKLLLLSRWLPSSR